MNTAIVITGLICATALINSAIVAARDVAKAKQQNARKAQNSKEDEG